MFNTQNTVIILFQVKKMRQEYGKLDKMVMNIWECCELLNEVVDESDPDLDEPQIQHLLQSAEAIRKDYPNEDWLHLTALIHGNYSLYSLYLQLTNNNFQYKNPKKMLTLNFQILGRFLLFHSLEGLPSGLLLVSLIIYGFYNEKEFN